MFLLQFLPHSLFYGVEWLQQKDCGTTIRYYLVICLLLKIEHPENVSGFNFPELNKCVFSLGKKDMMVRYKSFSYSQLHFASMWICTRDTPLLCVLTLSNLSFLRLHSSHSLTMRPHRIQVSSSRCERLDEAEELDTSEEPLFLREPLIERMDLESASRSLVVGGEELEFLLGTERLSFNMIWCCWPRCVKTDAWV